MTDRVDWKELRKRIMGVNEITNNIFQMRFKDDKRESLITSKHLHSEVLVCTFYFGNNTKTNDGETVKLVMQSSDNKNIRISNYVHDYMVFKKEISGCVDHILSEYSLRNEGFDVLFLPEMHDGLIINHMDIEWHILPEKKILATIRGDKLKKTEDICRSWEMIVQYIVIL